MMKFDLGQKKAVSGQMSGRFDRGLGLLEE